MARIRVLVVDDHRIFAESLAAALAAEPDVDVSAAGSGPAALRALERAAAEGRGYDVLLVDAELGAQTGGGELPAVPAPRQGEAAAVDGTLVAGVRAARPGVRSVVLAEKDARAPPPGRSRRALGMTEMPETPGCCRRPGGCWFAAGPVQLHLGIEEDFRAAKKAHPGLRVTGIEAYAARLESHGVHVTWDDNLPGHRRFYAHDPVGNRLEFLEPDA
ncbi:hypothetical protein SBADM41S_11209 [Streptomyces badius]